MGAAPGFGLQGGLGVTELGQEPVHHANEFIHRTGLVQKYSATSFINQDDLVLIQGTGKNRDVQIFVPGSLADFLNEFQAAVCTDAYVQIGEKQAREWVSFAIAEGTFTMKIGQGL